MSAGHCVVELGASSHGRWWRAQQLCAVHGLTQACECLGPIVEQCSAVRASAAEADIRSTACVVWCGWVGLCLCEGVPGTALSCHSWRVSALMHDPVRLAGRETCTDAAGSES